uniref:Uncharacterized protein n=1 Tax=Otolemur garnettii TaxID=30611 RepID=H0Y109_OTOGA
IPSSKMYYKIHNEHRATLKKSCFFLNRTKTIISLTKQIKKAKKLISAKVPRHGHTLKRKLTQVLRPRQQEFLGTSFSIIPMYSVMEHTLHERTSSGSRADPTEQTLQAVAATVTLVRGRAGAHAMAARPTLALLLLALLLQTQAEPEATAPTPTATPGGNASASPALPRKEVHAHGPRPTPGPLALLATLALRPVLG